MICPEYLGVSCINGACPIASTQEYAERGYDVISKCSDCPLYHGCEDCAWFNNPDPSLRCARGRSDGHS